MKKIFSGRALRYFLATLAVLCWPCCINRYCSVNDNNVQLAGGGGAAKELVTAMDVCRDVTVVISHGRFLATGPNRLKT